MGETDVRAMAGTVAAFVTMQDVYKAPPSTAREVTGALVGSWWAKQLAGNVVTVSVGLDTRQFFRRFDKQWLSPGPGAVATLVQSGERSIITTNACSNYPSYVTTRGWGNTEVSFQVTGPHGDVQSYVPWEVQVKDGTLTWCAVQRGFRLSNWVWPKGISISLEYSAGIANALPELLTVSNNLGRKLRFKKSGLEGFDNGLDGADSRAVVVRAPATSGLIEHEDPTGSITKFRISKVGNKYELNDIYLADNAGAKPSTSYKYDYRGDVSETWNINSAAYTYGSYLTTSRIDRYSALVKFPHRVSGQEYDEGYSIFVNDRGLPRLIYDETGEITRIDRDGRGRVLGYTYPELDRELISYDDRNNPTLLQKVAKLGSPEAAVSVAIQATWHPIWNKIASLTDPKGETTTLNYVASGGGAGELSSVVRPAVAGVAPIFQFSYNAFGQRLTSTDPTNVVTAYGYDPLNYLRTVTLDPAGIGATTTYTNNALGDPLSVDGPRADVSDVSYVSYDPMRRKVLEVQPSSGSSAAAKRMTYDPVGRPASIDAGYVSSGAFTPLIATSLVYDLIGNKVREVTPAGIVQFSYDGRDALVCTAKRMNPQAALPGEACEMSPQGSYGPDQITKNTYDAANRLTQITTGVGPLNVPFATYQYSPNGQRTAVIDGANNKTSLAYDGFDRLKVQYFPTTTRGAGAHNAGDREEYAYDPNGNRTSLRKRDATVIGFGYDALNRVITKTVATDAAQNVSYGYDLAGRMTSALYANTAQGVAMTYDTAGRLNTETSYGWTVDVDHDKAGARSRVTWPDGQAVDYVYDAASQLKEIREPGVLSGPGHLISIDYDELGRRTQMLRGNGGKATYGYDAAGRLSSLAQSGAANSPASLQSLSYTPASQLASLTQATAAYVWGGHPTVVKDYTHNGLNQDAAIAALGGGFDLNGNLTSSGIRTYAYNVDNRLTQATTAGQATNITYDPLGRMRSLRTGTGAWTYFLHSGDQLIGEYGAAVVGQPALRRYVHTDGIDEPVVWYEGADLSQRRWLHADRQGSIIGVSDAVGSVTPYTYGPYGEPNDWAGPRFRYTGQAALPEIQAYHYKARVYDPEMGRFLQTDPIGQEDDPNLYAYVKGDPANMADPTGEQGMADAQWRASVRQQLTDGRDGNGMPDHGGKRAGPTHITSYTKAGVGAIAGVGGTAGGGTYETRSIQTGRVTESGTYVSGSIDAGVELSVGGGVSAVEGQAQNGVSLRAAGSVGPVEVEVSGGEAGPTMGGGVAVGLSPLPLSGKIGMEIKQHFPVDPKLK